MTFEEPEVEGFGPKMKNLQIEIVDQDTLRKSTQFNHFDLLKQNQLETPRD